MLRNMDTNMKNIINFLFEVGSLKKIARSHRQSFLTDDLSDNIASHSHRVSVIGYFLAKSEGVDIGKVLTMCIFHDVGESRSGDQNWVHKKYVKVFEDEILKDQLDDITKDNGLFKIMSEYTERESVESKIAKDADKLDQYLLVKEYIMRGNKEAENWIKKKSPDDLYCQTAKDLFLQILETNPADWWKNIYTEKRR